MFKETSKELLDFFSEIYHIWKSGVDVTIAEIDTRIHKIYQYKGKFDGEINGRGGTNMDELFTKYDAIVAKPKVYPYSLSVDYCVCQVSEDFHTLSSFHQIVRYDIFFQNPLPAQMTFSEFSSHGCFP